MIFLSIFPSFFRQKREIIERETPGAHHCGTFSTLMQARNTPVVIYNESFLIRDDR
jgi:hypothetical protein